ncbi:universal stress protein [Sulfitobacter sp. SK012]|uniref:universal stress protein n=1 Tax=Sulfitobacter sp. SK012 TaxID=1389005 RepID=UPI000E0BE0B1|nr:universal stress protein [Sulfitobacter sp. SK012]AXI46666.1 universal stress protein [Sulfitobacter sp. SK012]
MYKKIVVTMALDHGISPETLAIAEALRADGGEIIGLHVYETPQGSVSAYLDADVVQAGYDKAQADLQAKVDGTANVTAVLIKGHSARGIIDYADANDVDCIVIGSHKPGRGRFLLGSTAARVVRHASCAVHVRRSID